MTENNSGYTAAALAEQLRKGDEDDLKETPTYWWMPYIQDEDTRQLLLVGKRAYNSGTKYGEDPKENPDMPDEYEGTNFFKDIFRKEAGKTVAEAISEQNLSEQSMVTGLQGDDEDVSGVRRMLQIGERVAGADAYIGYVYGDMGNGKTDFGVFLAELWAKQVGGSVGTNIESLQEKDEFIETFGDLEEWLDDSGEKLFVFDEASSHASGYAGDAGDVTSKFRGLLREFRKRDANLLIVGHTGKDVHPDIRRLATDCIHKTGKKTAVFYDTVEDGEGEGEKFDIEGIPATEWTFDTNEITEWSWEGTVEIEDDGSGESVVPEHGEGADGSMLDEDDREEVRYLYETTDMTQKQLAELKDVSQSTISKIV